MKKIIFVLVAYICVVFISCDKNYHDELIFKISDIENPEYKILDSEEEFSSGGEGFYFCIYELDNATLELLTKNINQQKSIVKPEYREDWNALEWSKTPIKNEDINLFNYCFEYSKSEKFKKNVLEKISPNDSQNYYCGFYKDDKKEPYYCDLFIFVPKEKKIYFISQKT